MSDILGLQQEQVDKYNLQNIQFCSVFQVTESARNKIQEILTGDEAKKLIVDQGGDISQEMFLRFAVMPGGCKGMQYDFSIDNQKEEGDLLIEDNGQVLVAIDNVSLPFVEGSTLDYYESLGASAFKVINPKTGGGCGCGKSFVAA